MNSKKVILFIVEGISDKNSLALILSRLIRNERIEFHIVGGDITSSKETTIKNCMIVVNEEVKKFLNVNRFKRSDLLRVVHLIDTDGAYIDFSMVKENNSEKVIYTEENLLAKNVDAIIERNNRKSKILNKLYNANSISKTDYRMYYFSCNLDHVLHNEQNLEDNLKYKYSDDFVGKYYEKEGEFVKFISNSDFSVRGDYIETWNFIKKDENSLKRYCNFNVFLKEYLE